MAAIHTQGERRGAVAVDAGRALTGSVPNTFMVVFGVEALLFLAAAAVSLRSPPRAVRFDREVVL